MRTFFMFAPEVEAFPLFIFLFCVGVCSVLQIWRHMEKNRFEKSSK